MSPYDVLCTARSGTDTQTTPVRDREGGKEVNREEAQRLVTKFDTPAQIIIGYAMTDDMRFRAILELRRRARETPVTHFEYLRLEVHTSDDSPLPVALTLLEGCFPAEELVDVATITGCLLLPGTAIIFYMNVPPREHFFGRPWRVQAHRLQ